MKFAPRPRLATWRVSLDANARWWAVVLAMLTTLGWLFIDLRLPFPYIFADETGFLIPARAIADPNFHPDGGGVGFALRSQSPVHSLVYSLTLAGGDGFFAYAQFFNCILAGLIVLPAFAVARRYLSPAAALAFAAVVAVNPWLSLSAHFMPETLYAFVFWVLAWGVLASPAAGRMAPFLAAAGCGAGATALFFTKPHALSVIAGIAAFFALRSVRALRRRDAGWWLGAAQSALFCLVVVGLMWGFAHLAGRTLGDVLFAGRYQSQAGDMFSMEKFALQAQGMWRQVSGHLSFAGVVYLAPLAYLVPSAWRVFTARDAAEETKGDLYSFVLAVLGLTVAMAVKFACDIMLTVDPNDIHRLSERYYGFMIPLLALPLLARREAVTGWVFRGLLVAGVAAIAAQLVFNGAWYRIYASDAPGYIWMHAALGANGHVNAGTILGFTVAGIAAGAYLFGHRARHALFVSAALVIAGVAGTEVYFRKWLESRSSIHFHAFSQMTRQINDAEWRQTVVVGDAAMVSVFLFRLDGLPRTLLLPPNATVTPDLLPTGVKWIILVRQHPLDVGPVESRYRYSGNGYFEILRLKP